MCVSAGPPAWPRLAWPGMAWAVLCCAGFIILFLLFFCYSIFMCCLFFPTLVCGVGRFYLSPVLLPSFLSFLPAPSSRPYSARNSNRLPLPIAAADPVVAVWCPPSVCKKSTLICSPRFARNQRLKCIRASRESKFPLLNSVGISSKWYFLFVCKFGLKLSVVAVEGQGANARFFSANSWQHCLWLVACGLQLVTHTGFGIF